MLEDVEYSLTPLVIRYALMLSVYAVAEVRPLNLYPGSGSSHGALRNPPMSCQSANTPPNTS